MPNRILKESIRTSATINELTPEEEVFFYRLLTACDDYGLMDARPVILRTQCFPLRIESISNADIERWLAKLDAVGLVKRYSSKGRPYLRVVTWHEHQQIRAKRSKYPEPESDNASDSIRDHTPSDDSTCPRNPIQSNPIQIESNHVSTSAAQAEAPAESESKAEPPKKVKTVFAPDSREFKIAAHLREWILRNNPGAKVPPLDSQRFQAWCKDVELMIRVDGRPPESIWRVINSCQQDQFWRSNILSTAKLRDKYDQLFLRMNSKPQRGSAPVVQIVQPPPEPADEVGHCDCGEPWQEWPDNGARYCPKCEPHGPPRPPDLGCPHPKVLHPVTKKLYCPRCHPSERDDWPAVREQLIQAHAPP